MPTQTEHYGLAAGVVTDDFIQPDHQNRVAETLDQVVGNIVKQILAAGVYNGWLIQEDKTVTAGWGILSGCWCATVTNQDITSLQNGAVNYIFAQTNQQSAPQGSVDFVAQLSPNGPPGSVCLGSIELDAQGDVVSIDNEEGATRGCFPLTTNTFSGSGTIEAVPGGGEVSFVVNHAEAGSFAIPGAIDFAVTGEAFTVTLRQTYQADRFEVVAVNENSYPQDLCYTWQRQGIVQ